MSVLPIPFDHAGAEELTSKIKARLRKIAEAAEDVVEMIATAKAGDIHKALGYASWPAYVTAEFGGLLSRLDKADRGSVVAALADAGLSTRAIAPVVGVSQKTVDRDLAQVSHDDSPRDRITGIDNKSYPRPATFLRSGKADSASTEAIGNAVPPVKRKAPRKPLPDAYRRTMWDLEKIVERLRRFHEDDRFLVNRANIGNGGTRPFSEVVEMLNDIENDLGGHLKCRDCEERVVPEWGHPYETLCSECRAGADE